MVERYPDVDCFNSGFGSLIIIDTVSQSKIVGTTTPVVLPVPGGATHNVDKHSSIINGVSLPLYLKYPNTIIKPLNKPSGLFHVPIFLISSTVALREDFSS